MPENETDNLPELGGRGEAILDALAPGNNRQRETLRLLNRAVLGRWEVPDKWCKTLPRVAAAIALNSEEYNPEVRLAAIKLLHSMTRDSLEAAIALERIRADGNVADEIRALNFEIVEAKRPARRIVSTQRGGNGNGRRSSKRTTKRKPKRRTKRGANGQDAD